VPGLQPNDESMLYAIALGRAGVRRRPQQPRLEPPHLPRLRGTPGRPAGAVRPTLGAADEVHGVLNAAGQDDHLLALLLEHG